ncbi:MAG: hypothetical protein EA402_08365 [Planctomycetota bacterium]|nr:MAG: hypothetical protein EA402_08365 [Planctomycetota bacterium]
MPSILHPLRYALALGLAATLSAAPLLSPPGQQLSATEQASPELPSRAEVRALADRGMAWMLAQQQDDGSFFDGPMFRLGITVFATLALLENGLDGDDERMQRAVTWIIGHQQADGGIYDPQEGLANYGTSVSLMILSRLDGVDPSIIERGRNYVLGIQNQDAESPLYGGFAYGANDRGREDLSNTAVSIEGLRAAGIPADHPAMQRALEFVQRTQNLSSTNDQPWAGEDGGAVYSPLPHRAGGSHGEATEAAEVDPTAPVPSVGTMTYALISSYLSLDIPADDPRVRAALDWARANYQFDANPGMAARHASDGLYYYYLLMATTFDRVNTTTLDTPKGEADWRRDLMQTIRERAREADGGVFWINESRRWGEGFPHLTSAYMLRALARIHDSLPETP